MHTSAEGNFNSFELLSVYFVFSLFSPLFPLVKFCLSLSRTHTHTLTHARTRTRTHTKGPTSTHTHTHKRPNLHTHTHTRKAQPTHAHTQAHTCTHTHTHTHERPNLSGHWGFCSQATLCQGGGWKPATVAHEGQQRGPKHSHCHHPETPGRA